MAKNCSCLLSIFANNSLLTPALLSTSSFAKFSVHGILSIPFKNHILVASIFFLKSFFIAFVLHPYMNSDHTKHFKNPYSNSHTHTQILQDLRHTIKCFLCYTKSFYNFFLAVSLAMNGISQINDTVYLLYFLFQTPFVTVIVSLLLVAVIVFF